MTLVRYRITDAPVLAAWLFIVAGLAGLLAAWHGHARDCAFQAVAQPAEGLVVRRVPAFPNGAARRTGRVVVGFRLADGRSVAFAAPDTQGALDEGRRVRLVYDPACPARATLSAATDGRPMALLALASAACLALGGFRARALRRGVFVTGAACSAAVDFPSARVLP